MRAPLPGRRAAPPINEPPATILPLPAPGTRRSYSTPLRSTFFHTTSAWYPGENPGPHRFPATQPTPRYIPEPSVPAPGIAGRSDGLGPSCPATEVGLPFRSLRRSPESDDRPCTRHARRVLVSTPRRSPRASYWDQSGEPPAGQATTSVNFESRPRQPAGQTPPQTRQ